MIENNMVELIKNKQHEQSKGLDCIMQREQKLKMGPGAIFYTKMTIVRLSNNDLFVHSPTKLDDQMVQDIKKFGNVKYIVCPNKMHYLAATGFKEKFPNAFLYAVDGLQIKKPEIKFDFILKSESNQDSSYQHPPFFQEIEYYMVDGGPEMNEVVFYHKATKSLICTDVIVNLTSVGYKNKFNCCQKCILSCIGFKINKVVGPVSQYAKNGDVYKLKSNIERILKWDIQNIIPTHGDILDKGDMKKIIQVAWEKILKK